MTLVQNQQDDLFSNTLSSSSHSLRYYYDNSHFNSPEQQPLFPQSTNRRYHDDNYNDNTSLNSSIEDAHEGTRLVNTNLMSYQYPTRNASQDSNMGNRNRYDTSRNSNTHFRYPQNAAYNHQRTDSVPSQLRIKRTKSKRLNTSALHRNNSVLSIQQSVRSNKSTTLPLPDFQASGVKASQNLKYSWKIHSNRKKFRNWRKQNKPMKSIIPKYKTKEQLYSIFKLLTHEHLPIDHLPEYLLQYSIPIKENFKTNPKLNYEIKRCDFYTHQYKVSLASTNYSVVDYYNIAKTLPSPPDETNAYNSHLQQQQLQPPLRRHVPSKSKDSTEIMRNKSISRAKLFDLPIREQNLHSRISPEPIDAHDRANRQSYYAQISINSSETNLVNDTHSNTEDIYYILKNLLFSQKFKSTEEMFKYINTSPEIRELVSSEDNANEDIKSSPLILHFLMEVYLRRIIAARISIKMGILQARRSSWSEAGSNNTRMEKDKVQSPDVIAPMPGYSRDSDYISVVSSTETRLKLEENGPKEDKQGDDDVELQDQEQDETWGDLLNVIKSVYGEQQTEFFKNQF